MKDGRQKKKENYSRVMRNHPEAMGGCIPPAISNYIPLELA